MLMTLVFSLTLLVSACLLFFIQPMVGKMLLPILGGSSSVWNTSMVFFQALLLVGYLYSHLSIRYLGVARQGVLHLGVLALPLLTLPIVVSSDLATGVPDGDPTIWLLGVLFVIAGLPFFAVSTRAPTFQKWFSETDHRHAEDPYFLYAASNAGSMAGLLLYPLFIERVAPIPVQSQIWHMGYLLFVGLTTICAILMWRGRKRKIALARKLGAAVEKAKDSATEALLNAEPLTARRRAFWVLLAFIPSSLMLGFTTYITTDIAPVPLLWVIPLALYLLSFILVFAARPIYAPWWVGRGMSLVALILVLSYALQVVHPAEFLMAIHLIFYCAAIMVAHGQLAKDRPHPRHLTEYFLWISIGGVAGGAFNALIAPLLFTEIYEYILVIILACLIRETRPDEYAGQTLKKAVIVWTIIAVTSVAAALYLNHLIATGQTPVLGILAFLIPAFAAATLLERPSFFTPALVLIVIGGSFYHGPNQAPIFHERNFYGSVRVADTYDGRFRNYVDGNTIHGKELLDDPDCTPLSYFHRTGPVGIIFENYAARVSTPAPPANIAVIGMGMGSIVCYGRPNEHWDLYEINPLVVEIATNPDYFSVLDRADTGSQAIHLGDGRLRIAEAPEDHFDIIILDAFSSGYVPIHLITREAIDLYASRLTDRGLIAFNISSRVFNLQPILANIAASLDLHAYALHDAAVTPEELDAGKSPSSWVVLSPDRENLAVLTILEEIDHPRVQKLQGDPDARVWTDGFSDIITPLLDR